MKAIVFAAGLGTRLGEFTKSHPKALVEVGGMPMLGRVLIKLREAGVRDVVVNVHHFAEQIKDYLVSSADFGLNIHVSDESGMLLETGGGILAARSFLEGADRIILHNADILTDFPLEQMLATHNERHNDATLLVAERDTSRYLLFAQDTRMRGWTNISTGRCRPEGFVPSGDMIMRAFGGVHVMSPDVLDRLAAYNDTLVRGGAAVDSHGVCRFSIMDFYIDNCSDMRFGAYEPSDPYCWCDIGKPESLALAQKLVAGGL